MVIAPNTNIRLIKCPIELDNRNQLTFSSKTNQYNYFNSLPKVSLDNATYQRKDNVLRFPTDSNLTFEDLLQYNYCMYQNNSYDSKWFYAFITNISYENNGMSLITLETDVFQTWQFDITYKASFIEREHVNDDSIGAHTLPEGLETGDYIVNGYQKDTNFGDYAFIIQSTERGAWDSGTGEPVGIDFGGTVAPGIAYVADTVPALMTMLAQGFSVDTAIFNVYMIPKKFAPSDNNFVLSINDNPITYSLSFKKQTTLDGYTPKNNKLLCFPYNYIVIDNNNGTSNILNYEYFTNNTYCTFQVEGVPTVGGSIKCVPTNYKNVGRYEQEGIMAGKFPTCGWVNDVYTNWLTQQAVNLQVGMTATKMRLLGNMVKAGEKTVSALKNKSLSSAGISASSVIEDTASTYEAVGRITGMMYEHEMTPNTACGNTNGGDISTSYYTNAFHFIKMSIKQEYARSIDDFFSMFGYKVNRMKTPNITGRQNWNYVKTSGCNFIGDIPQNDMQIIKTMFNNGVTLWHNSNTFLDYSQSNNIV